MSRSPREPGASEPRGAAPEPDPVPKVGLGEFQRRIEAIYFQKDAARGVAATYMWFAEEVGELTRALRRAADRAHLEEEFADVLAWLCTLASIHGVDMERAVARKYGNGCPYCGATPCACGGEAGAV